MKTKVFDLKLGSVDPHCLPQEVSQMGAYPDGLYFKNRESGSVPFSKIRCLAVLNLQCKEKKRALLLVVLAKRASPVMVAAQHIHYGEFPGLSEEVTSPNLQKCVRLICKKCPSLALDRATYTFLKRGHSNILNEEDLPSFATALVQLPKPGSPAPEPTDSKPTLPSGEPAADHIEGAFPEMQDEKADPAKPFLEAFPELGEDPAPIQISELADNMSDEVFTGNAPPDMSTDDDLPASLPQDLGEGSLELDVSQPLPQPLADEPEPDEPEPDKVCPNCGDQLTAPECASCGVIVSKFLEHKRHQAEAAALAQESEEDILPNGSVFPEGLLTLTQKKERHYSDRFLSMDAALKMAFTLARAHFLDLVGLAVIIQLLGLGVTFLVSFFTQDHPIIGSLFVSLVWVATWTLTTLALIFYLDRVVKENFCAIGDALTSAFQRFPQAFMARLTAILLIVLGLFAMIVPGLIYGLQFFFLEAVCATEKVNFQEAGACRISQNLVRGYEFSVLSYLVTMAVLLLASYYLPAHVAGLLAGPQALAQALLNGTLSILILILALIVVISGAIFSAVLTFVLYLELRTLNSEFMFVANLRLSLFTKVVLIIDVVLFVWISVRFFMP